MEIFNAPSISVSGKTSEENIQVLKGWANNVTETLNFYLTSMQNRIDELEKQIQKLEGE